MKKLIFIGGYSGAGKTTALEFLKNKYSVHSSSLLLHSLAKSVYKIFYNYELDTTDRNEKTFINSNSSNEIFIPLTIREYLIKLAEDALVKVFGRSVFAYKIIHDIMNSLEDVFIIETLGGVEFLEFKRIQELLLKDCTCININIRRISEKKGVDIRELLPIAIEINNNFSIEFLQFSLTSIIEDLG